MKPKVIAFCGPSGSGKTTFLCTLIAELRARHVKVGAVKHCHCTIASDERNKDSAKLRRAGADPVFAIPQCNDLKIIEHHYAEHDIVLAEGFRSANLPSILVYRQPIPDDWTLPKDVIYKLFLPPLQQTQPITQTLHVLHQYLPSVYKRSKKPLRLNYPINSGQ